MSFCRFGPIARIASDDSQMLPLSDASPGFAASSPGEGPYFKLLETKYAVELVERGIGRIVNL